MLVLTRKQQQQIQIGEGITITILKVKGNAVRIGIDAPADVKIVRSELEPEEEATPEQPQSAGKSSRIDQTESARGPAAQAVATQEDGYRVLSFRVQPDGTTKSNDSPRAASMRDFLAMRSTNTVR